MIHKPPKLQLSLTIQFAVFFIIVAGFIYFYFSEKFEEEILDKFMFKAEVISTFIERNPEYFNSNKFGEKTEIIQLMSLNEINYLVLENHEGQLVDAVNLDLAEYYLYVSADERDYISFDESIYKVVLPVQQGETQLGKCIWVLVLKKSLLN
jgi:hypothetical protein